MWYVSIYYVLIILMGFIGKGISVVQLHAKSVESHHLIF